MSRLHRPAGARAVAAADLSQTPAREAADTAVAVWERQVELAARGRAVRELRARRGFSQEQLGVRSALHRNYVGAVERGEINSTFRVLMKRTCGTSRSRSSSRSSSASAHGPSPAGTGSAHDACNCALAQL